MKDFLQEYFRSLIYLLAFACLVAGWFLLRRAPSWVLSLRSANWSPTEGRIETAKVTAFGDQALAELGYSYLVETSRYSGYYSTQFADEQQAWDYIRNLQGQSVVVRYKPGDPEVSALRGSDQQSHVNLRGPGFFSSLWTAFFNQARELLHVRRG